MRRSRIRENRGKTIRNSRAKPPITQIKRGHRPLRDCRQFIKVKPVIVFRFSKMRALKDVRIKFMDKEVSCTALFDTDSSITAIQRSFFERNFGTKWLRLYWINGELIVVDKHAQLSIVIDGFDLPETVFIIDDFVKEIMIDDKRITPQINSRLRNHGQIWNNTRPQGGPQIYKSHINALRQHKDNNSLCRQKVI